MALSPDVVIADEPTTALDVISQDNVLGRLLELQRKEGTSLIIISHDMGVIAETCDRVAVMYAGSLVEVGPVRDLFRAPSHPYTMGLQNAIPRFDQQLSVVSIPGFPPSSFDDAGGCRFLPRCPFAILACEEYPPFVGVAPGHEAACFRAHEGHALRAAAADPTAWIADGQVRSAQAPE
jgi:oligopeptide/dipeptide ABC transporter ATP-binding protein